MLILTRRVGDSVVISDEAREVRISVLAIRGSQVRLGFDAPEEIAVHREEVHERIKCERSKGRDQAT